MRHPSDTRSAPAPERRPRRRGAATVLAVVLVMLTVLAALLVSAAPAAAQTTVPATYQYEGPIDYVVAGASLRTGTNASGNSCDVRSNTTNTTVTVSGIPAGATVLAAWLYWAGSGSTVDNVVRLNGTDRTADRTATATYNNNGTLLSFFSAVENVTGTITGNGTYTLSRLAVDSDNPYCPVSAVMGGFTIFVVYRHDAEPLRRVEIREAFTAMRGASASLFMSGFIASSTPNAKLSLIAYEGDPDIDGDATGREEVTINGSVVSAPANNAFDGAYGYDLDSWAGSSLLGANARSITMGLSAGGDLLLLHSLISSINIQMVDVTPKGLATPVSRLGGGTAKFSQVFSVENASSTTQAYDLLARYTGSPAFITIDSIRGTGLTYSAARGDSARTPALAAGATANYTVWYRVAAGALADNVEFLKARSVTYPTRAEAASEGWQEIRRVTPSLTLAKSVTPNTGIKPGIDLTYTLKPTNAGAVDVNSVVVEDEVPTQTQFKLGSMTSALPAGVTAALAYSNNGGTNWTYVPVSGGCSAPAGYDGCVNRVRWTLTGTVPAGNAATTLTYQAKVK